MSTKDWVRQLRLLEGKVPVTITIGIGGGITAIGTEAQKFTDKYEKERERERKEEQE